MAHVMRLIASSLEPESLRLRYPDTPCHLLKNEVILTQ